MALNKVIGYKRQPIQGNLLWTQGQKVRKSSKEVRIHAEVAIQDIDTKISTVVSALKSSPSGSLKANVLDGLMKSNELKAKIDEVEKKQVERMNQLGKDLENILSNPKKSTMGLNWYTGPEGVLNRLAEEAAQAYDQTCPTELPKEIEKLVDVSHEAEQYKNKETRMLSGKFKESVKHDLGTGLGHMLGGRMVKNATEQSMKLDEAVDKLDKKELEEFIAKYSGDALYATVLLTARETGEVRKLIDFLKEMDIEKARKYSPFRTYKSENSSSSTSANSSTKTTSPDNSSAGATQKASEVQNRKAISQVTAHAKELEEAIKQVSDKNDNAIINRTNHMSLEFTMFAKSIMGFLEPEDRQRVREIVDRINEEFEKKAASTGLKVRYIPNVKYFDLSVEDEPKFINSWNEYILELHKKKEPIFLSPDGDALAIGELEDLLKMMNKTTRYSYNIFGSLARDSGLDGRLLSNEELDVSTGTFGT